MTNNVEWKRAQAAKLMLQGLDPSEVAELLEVKRATIMEWQHHADFKAALYAIAQDLAAQMDIKMLRAGLTRFQYSYTSSQKYPHSEDEYAKLEKIALLLKKNDLLAKTSHESPMKIPSDALDLSEFVRK